ncbi:MAG: LCP family protein, partial [Eggerthellaceae bacterium]|nr:LCP family protein [Eggerthellaceae bacterium]
AAYTCGGPALAIKAVSQLAGVDISHYAEIDFDGFAAMVDALGGVEVDVPVDIDDWTAGGSVSAGLHTLSGEEALILCRSRATYADSAAPDLMRAANQRLVLSAIAHKLLASDIATIAATVSAMSEYVTTDLALNDIIGLAQVMQGLDSADDIYTASFPTESVYIYNGATYVSQGATVPTGSVDPNIDEGYYLLPDEGEWQKMKARMEKGEPPAAGTIVDEATGTVLATAGADADDVTEKYSSVIVKNATDTQGLAARTSNALEKAGFQNVMIGEVVGNEKYPETIVVYNDASKEYEAGLIVKAMGQGKAILNDGSYLMDTDFLVVIGDDWKSGESS